MYALVPRVVEVENAPHAGHPGVREDEERDAFGGELGHSPEDESQDPGGEQRPQQNPAHPQHRLAVAKLDLSTGEHADEVAVMHDVAQVLAKWGAPGQDHEPGSLAGTASGLGDGGVGALRLAHRAGHRDPADFVRRPRRSNRAGARSVRTMPDPRRHESEPSIDDTRRSSWAIRSRALGDLERGVRHRRPARRRVPRARTAATPWRGPRSIIHSTSSGGTAPAATASRYVSIQSSRSGFSSFFQGWVGTIV